jgi:signal transduction histidine kinase
VARRLTRIWVRFALGIAATVIVTVGVLGASVMVFAELQYRNFYRSLPVGVQREMDGLNAADLDDSPRALEIYIQYWRGDMLFGERWSLLIGLLVCLPIGLALGFWVSRVVTLPLASMAEAANRIALGDLSVRAEPGRHGGEMADMVRDFNRMTDALEALEKERKATAAALSHELRTPLAVLRARLHALCDGVINVNDAEMQRLLVQVEHLSRLVDDMHTLTIADAGRLSLHNTDLDLAALAAEVLAAHASRSADFGTAAELHAPGGPVLVHADPDRLRQVLSNLLDNALRYAAGSGRIEVGVVADGGDAVLTVSDGGPGLPPDVQRHLFERFHRPDASRSRATGGSGLGLSIVQALVQRMGGSVSAGTSPQGGAQFTIRLPRTPASAPVA